MGPRGPGQGLSWGELFRGGCWRTRPRTVRLLGPSGGLWAWSWVPQRGGGCRFRQKHQKNVLWWTGRKGKGWGWASRQRGSLMQAGGRWGGQAVSQGDHLAGCPAAGLRQGPAAGGRAGAGPGQGGQHDPDAVQRRADSQGWAAPAGRADVPQVGQAPPHPQGLGRAPRFC